jgi:Na+/H+ antiporter
MLYTFLQYIILVLAILFMVMLAQKLKIAYPIVLVLGGLVFSFIPGLPLIQINPELIFVIFLPPLLYETAWFTSWKDFWRWRRVIVSFAFIVVFVTSFVVAIFSSMLIPGFTMALGFLLGAIISPPDAVSATTVMKHVTVPKRTSAIVEGESLLNDASSLIIFRFALIAVDTGHFILHEAIGSFVLVVALGILIGIGVALIYYAIHKWMPTNSHIDIVLTLTAPYAMYIAAEAFHFSGVLAVVSGGLFLSYRSHLFLNYQSRFQSHSVWGTLSFIMNGLVFILIGLELPVIVAQLGNVSLSSAIGYGLLISVVLIVSRILCTLGASVFTVFISRYIKTADNRPGWKGPIILGWAGMRGVVSLAAALSIPIYLTDHSDFPQRNLILFITFVVILVTLVLQGLTLPMVIKWVNMEDPDHHLPLEHQHLIVRRKLAEHSVRFLNDQHGELLQHNIALQQLRDKFESDKFELDQDAEVEQTDFRKVYKNLLAHQRQLLIELNRDLETDEEIIRNYQDMLDIEEEKMRIRYEAV